MAEIRNCKVLVVGAGPGGYVAAIRAGQLGLDTVIVERMMLVGNYAYSNSSISLSDSLNNSCVERITWNDDISFFIGNYCLGSEEPYMKKYNGIVVIN